RPYDRNPRKNEQAVDRMIASILEFGFKIPILVRTGGEVVDGHLRLKAAKKMSMTEVAVLRCDEWTDAQVKAFRLMVNRSATWAEWDSELVALELKELEAIDFNLDLTGFDLREIDDFLLEERQGKPETESNETSERATTQLGDLWICGPHRILCG